MEVELLEYDMGEGVRAFSTTRHGGYSHGAYGEFNINPWCGDNDDDVRRNLELLAAKLNIDANHIVLPHQVHGALSGVVYSEFFLNDKDMRRRAMKGFDGLITEVRGACMGVSTADCIPILLHDPVHHVVAAIHAGWRGTLKGVLPDAFSYIKLNWRMRPKDLRVVIGPGISLRNFEVGQEVYDQFSKAGFPMQEIARRYPVSRKGAGEGASENAGPCDEPAEKWHLDLKGCNKNFLLKEGVPEENIYDCGICTFDSTDDFFSARRLGTESGRIYTGIMLE